MTASVTNSPTNLPPGLQCSVEGRGVPGHEPIGTMAGELVAEPAPAKGCLQNHRRSLGPTAQLLTQRNAVAMLEPLPQTIRPPSSRAVMRPNIRWQSQPACTTVRFVLMAVSQDPDSHAGDHTPRRVTVLHWVTKVVGWSGPIAPGSAKTARREVPITRMPATQGPFVPGEKQRPKGHGPP